MASCDQHFFLNQGLADKVHSKQPDCHLITENGAEVFAIDREIYFKFLPPDTEMQLYRGLVRFNFGYLPDTVFYCYVIYRSKVTQVNSNFRMTFKSFVTGLTTAKVK